MAIRNLSDISVDNDITLSGSYQIDGIDIINTSSTYTQIRNPEGDRCIFLGDSADPTTYFDNTGFYFRSAGGNSNYLVIGSGGATFENRVDIKDDLRIRGAGGNPSQGIVRFYTDSTNKLNIDTGNTGSNLTTIDSSGNVSISATLDVASTIYTAESLRFDGTGLNATDKKLYSPTDGELQWFTHDLAGAHAFSVSHQGTRRVYLNTSGDSYFTGGEVGIGTATPTNMLSIKGSSGSSKGLEIFHSNGNKVAELIHNGSGDEGMLRLLDSNSETVRIAGETNVDSYINSGNVGIGTATPSAKLEVNGDILVTGVYDTVYNDTSVAQQWYKFYEKTGAAGGDLLHFALLTVNNAEFMAEVRIFVPTYAGFSSGYGSLSNGQGAQVEIRMGGLNSQTNILEAIDEVANLGSTSTFLQLYLRIDPAFSNTEVRVINYPDATVHFSTSGTWTTTDPRSGLSTRSFPFYNGNTALNNTLNITSDNEVGIGVGAQNPTTALEVRNDDGLGNGLHLIADFNRAGGTDAQLILGYFANGTNATGPVVYAANGFPLLFSSGSVERVRIDSSGNLQVGDGTISAAGMIHAYKSSALADLVLQSAGGSGRAWRFISDTDGRFYIRDNNAASNRFYIDTSGNVGIGTTSPTTPLSVSDGASMYGNSNYLVQIKRNAANGNDNTSKASILLANNSNGMQIAYGGTTDRLRFIDGSGTEQITLLNGGNVGIGDTSPAKPLVVYSAAPPGGVTIKAQSGNASSWIQNVSTGSSWQIGSTSAGWQLYNDNTSAYRMTVTNAGSLTVSGDVVAYGSPSDITLKENIKPIKSALEKVTKLQGVTFDWKESDSILEIKEDIGFIAQDVQEVLPELVRENEDGKLSLRDKGIVPILVEAIKELKAEIEELKKSK